MQQLAIQTLEDGRWYDRDDVLLHAAFQALVDFMEQERPGEIIDWEAGELYRHVWSEITALYQWWKEERPVRPDKYDEVPEIPEEPFQIAENGRVTFPDRELYPEYYAALDRAREQEEAWHEEDQRNLHRLVDVRPFLWT